MNRALALIGTVIALAATSGLSADQARLLTLTNFSGFQREIRGENHLILTSPDLSPGFPWQELIVSWNASSNVALSVGARPVLSDGTSFLSLCHWAAQPGWETPRESVNGQKEPWGEVQTDLLVLKQPAVSAQLRLEVRGPETGFKRVSLAFFGTNSPATNGEPADEAWGTDLAVPIRSQADYPEGVTKWCSPTSTAMLMTYWGERRARPDWIHPVPETAQAVFDPGWGGTGNWPFNMAFAGSHPGLNAAVARWEGLTDLERWVRSGLPAAISVSNALLKGHAAAEKGDGHLVVVRGFTPDGDIIVNDPGVRRERVRRVVPRADLDRAWAHSHRTVYLVWPDDQALPAGPQYPR